MDTTVGSDGYSSAGARAPSGRRGGLGLVAVVSLLLVAALLECAAAEGKPVPVPRYTAVSSNWAGYVATGAAGQAARFRSVSAHWVQPSATCASGEGFSGFWVGLGGYRQSSQALEQIGTEADCNAAGTGRYFAWSELVPNGPLGLRLKIRPGDSIVASVTVVGRHVRLALRDLTSGAGYAKTQRAATTDTASAEWIAEAPSVCASQTNCQVLPLANFGSVAFTDVSATSSNGHTGPVSDSAWSLAALELQDSGGGFGPARLRSSPTVATAAPSSLATTASAFTVTWQQASAPSSSPSPVGPVGG